MLSQFEASKKLEYIKNDNFRQMEEYFRDKNIVNARMKFKIRSKVVEKITENFKNRYKYNEEGLNCIEFLTEMTQFHRTNCPARATLGEGLDMSSPGYLKLRGGIGTQFLNKSGLANMRKYFFATKKNTINDF